MEKRNEEYYTIDVLHIVQALWHKILLIALVGLLCAALGFALSAFVIAPSYSASVMLYVKNSENATNNNPNFSISSSEITAAQSLVKTYSEILNNRTTLEIVIARAGVSYTYKELSEMIKATPSNNTEIMKVTVVSKDPEEAAVIANVVRDVLEERIYEIIGAEVKPVEDAVPCYDRVSPSITIYTVIGFLIGVLGASALVVTFALLDDRIHDEEYVLQNYDCPVLAKIPDLTHSKSKRYGYYYQHHDGAKQ